MKMSATMKMLAGILVLLFCVQYVSGAPAPDPVVKETLDALNKRGKDLNDFTADVTLTTNDDLGRDTADLGKVFYQRLGDDARIRVNFDRKKIGDKVIAQHHEYILAAGKLIDTNFETKVVVIRQVLKPGQKLNPLKLGEGPFPLPIGQEPEEVLKTFAAARIAPDKEDPADSTHLELKPKTGTPFFPKFATIDVFVSKKSGFPVRIVTTGKDGVHTTRTTDLADIKINAGLKDADFTVPTPGAGWRVRDEPLQD